MYYLVRALLIWLLCLLSVFFHELGHALGYRISPRKAGWKVIAGSGPKIISTSKYKYTITPTDASGTNSLYVTLHSLADATFWFEATGTDGKPYIAKGTSKLKLGEFYQTTLKMATVGDVILSNGKFAAPKTEGA